MDCTKVAADCPYHRYGDYLRARLGRKTHKVSIDAGFSCPNREDGGQGCAWCNNSSFNHNRRELGHGVQEQLRAGIAQMRRKSGADSFIAYFQTYTNTHAPVEVLHALFTAALAVEGVAGIAIGTRPDCIDAPKLDMLQELARTHYVQIEYGLQSANDQTLANCGRGHTTADFTRALALSRGRGIDLCAHMIIGLPGEDMADYRRTLQTIADSGADGVKIHNLHIVRDTPLAQEYARAPFALPTLEEYANIICDLLEQLPWRVNIQRLSGASGRRELHIAPDWCLAGGAVRAAIEAEFKRRGTRQGFSCGTA